jgi:hypothetical protein
MRDDIQRSPLRSYESRLIQFCPVNASILHPFEGGIHLRQLPDPSPWNESETSKMDNTCLIHLGRLELNQ